MVFHVNGQNVVLSTSTVNALANILADAQSNRDKSITTDRELLHLEVALRRSL